MKENSHYHQTEAQMRTEYEIVEASKKDIAYFAPLYEKYYRQIFLYHQQRVEDKETAFDLTSQTFLKAMCSLHKYQFKGLPFSSWLYRIAHNEMIEAFRKKKAERVVNVQDEYLKNVMEEINVDGYEVYFPKLLGFISDLPEDELHLIEMRFFEKRAFREIAEVLCITENNAKVKMHRLLEKLKKDFLNKVKAD